MRADDDDDVRDELASPETGEEAHEIVAYLASLVAEYLPDIALAQGCTAEEFLAPMVEAVLSNP